MNETYSKRGLQKKSADPEAPTYRKLRGYAFDPSLSNRLETYLINEITYEVPWETVVTNNGNLSGEYLNTPNLQTTIL